MIPQGLNDLPFLGGGSLLLRGLTSYWKMNEQVSSGTRADSRGTQDLLDVNNNVSANTSSGILAGVYANFIPEVATKALQASSTPYVGNASFTISGWIDWAATIATPQIAKWGGSSNEYLLWDQTGGSPIVWQAVEAGTLATKTLNLAMGTPGVWHYITFGYDDGNKQLFAYVNAVSQGVTACNGVNVSTNVLTFGNYSVISTSDQSGFQDFGFWRRVLSSAEVASLYNGGSGLAFNQF